MREALIHSLYQEDPQRKGTCPHSIKVMNCHSAKIWTWLSSLLLSYLGQSSGTPMSTYFRLADHQAANKLLTLSVHLFSWHYFPNTFICSSGEVQSLSASDSLRSMDRLEPLSIIIRSCSKLPCPIDKWWRLPSSHPLSSTLCPMQPSPHHFD